MKTLKYLLSRVGIYLILGVFIVPILVFILLGIASKDSMKKSSTEKSNLTLSTEKVPLPSKEDTIRSFCNLIDEGKVSEAVNMMKVDNDSEWQAWGVNFNSLSSFKLIDIQKSQIDESGNSYEVDIDVTLKEEKNSFGWVNGINKRWINLVEREVGKYKIAEIATGP